MLFRSGNSKYRLRDYQGAIADYNKAIEINPQDANAYKNRGNSMELVGDLKGACADLKRAVSLGHEDTSKYLQSEVGSWCRNMP